MIKMAKGKMTELSYPVCVGEWMVVLMEKSSWSNCWKTYSAELQPNTDKSFVWRCHVCRDKCVFFLVYSNNIPHTVVQ